MVKIGLAVKRRSFETADDDDGGAIYPINYPEAFGSGQLKKMHLKLKIDTFKNLSQSGVLDINVLCELITVYIVLNLPKCI